MGKLPSSFTAICVFTPTALQHLALALPCKKQCLIFQLENQTEIEISILVGSLEIEASLGWMLPSAFDLVGRVADVLKGESMDYSVVVFILLEEVASPVGSSMRHQSIIEYIV